MTQVQTMTEYEMTEQLAAKMNISLEEAKAALEAGNWNTLTATHLLEQEKFRRMQELNAVAASAREISDDVEPDAAGSKAADVRIDVAEAPARGNSKKTRGTGGLKRFGRAIADLIALGNRNRFAIHRGGEQLLEMPVTVLAVLLLFSFGTCALLLAVGLFAGCRYSINGNSIGVEA